MNGNFFIQKGALSVAGQIMDSDFYLKEMCIRDRYRPVCNTKWCDGYPDRFYSGSGIPVCFF